MPRRVRLIDEVGRVRPNLVDPEAAIVGRRVFVDGVLVTNPRSLVVRGCSLVVRTVRELRGSVKLRTALDGFRVEV